MRFKKEKINSILTFILRIAKSGYFLSFSVGVFFVCVCVRIIQPKILNQNLKPRSIKRPNFLYMALFFSFFFVFLFFWGFFWGGGGWVGWRIIGLAMSMHVSLLVLHRANQNEHFFSVHVKIKQCLFIYLNLMCVWSSRKKNLLF